MLVHVLPVGLQDRFELGQVPGCIWPQSLQHQHHQQLDDQQMGDVSLCANTHHRIGRHTDADHHIGHLGQSGVGLGDGDHFGPLGSGKADRFEQEGHASHMRNRHCHARRPQSGCRDELLVGIVYRMRMTPQAKQAPLQVTRHER